MRPVVLRNNALRNIDVAVIGGGAVGACTAWELARSGATVALLERGPELAWGCSAGNAGIVGPSHVPTARNPGSGSGRPSLDDAAGQPVLRAPEPGRRAVAQPVRRRIGAGPCPPVA